MEAFAGQLLQTKLHRPRVPHDLVLRPRLFERLDRGTLGPLTLVSAAAGYGKTTLVTSWIESRTAEYGAPNGARFGAASSFQVAWVSLDEMDSDLRRFLQYLVASLRTIFAGACAGTVDLLQARRDPPVERLAAMFGNEIEQLPRDVILVLDDHQSVSDAEIADFLSQLTRHWPAPLHLVLISRHDPMLLPLAVLRARGLLTEIRTRDLRFTPEETERYLNQALPAAVERSASERLDRYVEGWIAGIQLAAISLRLADDAEAALADLSGTEADFAEYLTNEVLAHQPGPIRKFLLQTAMLDHFCAPLCEAVMTDGDPEWPAPTCIDWLERTNLFIVPLDNRKEWYRYHHIFRDVLRGRAMDELGPERMDDLRCSAAGWFEERGMTDQALGHALAAHDLDMAARLMQQGLCDVLNREDRPTLDRWLHLLPEEMIQARPGLLIMKAWSQHLSGQALDKVLARLALLLEQDSAPTLSADEAQIVRGQMLELEGKEAYNANDFASSMAYCREALRLLPERWSYARSGSVLYLGLAMQASGEDREAEQLLVENYQALRSKTGTQGLRLLTGLCLMHHNQAQDLERIKKTAQRLLEGAELSGLGVMRGWGRYFLGIAHYERNELEAAREHFAKLVEYRYTAHLGMLRDGARRLAGIYLSMGQAAEAWQVVDLLSQIDLDYFGHESEHTASVRACMRLMEGDLEGAARWADSFRESVPDQAQLFMHSPHLSKARILIARGAPGDLQAALEILAAFYDIAERSHNTRVKIEVLALRTIGLRAQCKGDEAKAALLTAVNRARPGGFVRPFVELGLPMREALRELAREANIRGGRQGSSGEAIRRILDVFPDRAADPVAGAGYIPKTSHTSPVVPPLAESLTTREVEILTLLAGPLSLKEIAAQLRITLGTVKSHTLHIYGKFGVNKRRDAVATAEALGILPRP